VLGRGSRFGAEPNAALLQLRAKQSVLSFSFNRFLNELHLGKLSETVVVRSHSPARPRGQSLSCLRYSSETGQRRSIWARSSTAARAITEAFTVAAACDNARGAGLCAYVGAPVLAGWQREEIAAHSAAGRPDLRLRVPSGDADPCGPTLAGEDAACAEGHDENDKFAH